jgi:hypothetical protein
MSAGLQSRQGGQGSQGPQLPQALPTPPERPEVVDAFAVRGPRAVTSVCVRCAGVLAVVNFTLATAAGLVAGGASGAGWGFEVVTLAWLFALLPIAVVGWPAGLLTAHLLRRQPSERVHVLVFALVGAVLCPALLVAGGLPVGSSQWLAVLAVAEGALGAGGGRWWTGRVRRRRAAGLAVVGGGSRAAAASTPGPAAG